MAYEKQTWIPYDDNKTEEQNIQNGAVATAERMNHIENGVEAQATKIELKNHLEDKENPHEVTAHQVGTLTAEESSANVIYQVMGKGNALFTLRADYSGKIFESLEENVNVAKRSSAGNGSPTRILSPNEFSIEVNQVGYDLIAQEDAIVYNFEAHNDNGIIQVLFQYNVVEILERQLGEKFFKDRGAISLLQKTAVAREIITVINPAVWGYGASGTGNKLNYRVWINNSSWGGERSNSSSTITKIEYSTTDSAANNYISDDGYLYAIAYTEPRTGSVSSVINIDYAALDITIELSAREQIEYMIAANHEENIGNVDNYGTATQAEAEAGSASDKFMTPLGTKQYVSSRVATQTETEGGTSSEKLMTPLRTKQHVDSRMADFSEISVGQSDDKIVSPKALKEASIIPIKISEWTNIPLVSTAEAADNTTPQYRIITFSSGENTCTKVELRGAVRSSSTHNIPSSNYSFNVSKLPSDIRPSQTALVPCGTGHMSFTARGAVTPAGDLLLGNQSGVSFDYAYLDSLTYWLD